ncbi:NAD-dependent malic enzyme [Candidatus Peregrinibacteria bacterium]|nr:NAD-dependent malic enzyme [Candidatus Peregrinibacteria bacterium]
MNDNNFTDEALKYHRFPVPGKIFTGISKPVETQNDLSLSYTPGVGSVSSKIAKNEEEVYKYTNCGNSVAIVTDGTAVLGLGDIGPKAALPVMEGKLILFKKFANIDGYPLCLKFDKTENEEEYIRNFITAVKPLEPSFAGINLEDIKAPLCFKIQEELDRLMNIPVFHDDQDGTAIIILAALINALKLADKKIEEIKIVINGAGAAGLATAKLLTSYKISKSQIFVCDTQGLITQNRSDLTEYKKDFAQYRPPQDISEVIKNADVFIGVSKANILRENHVKSMNRKPIIFAMANPVPEIMPKEAKNGGAFIIATGRSDYPNQANNALCFPGLFRGAFDVRATTINLEMKLAAANAIASLMHEPFDLETKDGLKKAYPSEAALFDKDIALSQDYILPKIFDTRVAGKIAKAVSEAAIKTKVATIPN